jgi:DNA-binding NarL/FixJ family response regulator
MVPEMLHAGAKAYIVKDEVTDYLVEAIYAVCAGETFLSPLAQEYMDNYTTQAAHLHLTQRERDVLILLVQGCSTITIAERLKVDPRSVHNYIFQLRKKTGCESRMDLCNWYRRLYGEVSATAADQKIVGK